MNSLALLMQRHLAFVGLLALLLVSIPIPPFIDALALRPSYSLAEHLLEAWRLFTGHIVHASWPHLFVNLINLLLLRFVFREWISNRLLIGFLCFSALFISIGLSLSSDLYAYMGFSGIFHGLLALLLLMGWKEAPVLFTFALGCLIAKVLYEYAFGASPALAEFIGIGIATDSHGLGLMSGGLFFVLLCLSKRYLSEYY